jgi:hypothetical protein
MKSLQDYQSDAQTNVFNKYNAFFAFSNDQVKEAEERLNCQGKAIAAAGAGLHFFFDKPTESAKEIYKSMYEELDQIHIAAVKLRHEEYGAERIVNYEYFNYETHISWDGTEPVEAEMKKYQEVYPEIYTNQFLQQQFNRCYQQAVNEDLF